MRLLLLTLLVFVSFWAAVCGVEGMGPVRSPPPDAPTVKSSYWDTHPQEPPKEPERGPHHPLQKKKKKPRSQPSSSTESLMLDAIDKANDFPLKVKIERVEDLDLDDFNVKYASTFLARPVIISNSQSKFDADDWTIEKLKSYCGKNALRYDRNCDVHSPNCHSVRQLDRDLIGKQWAGLKNADLTSLGINTISELIDSRNKEGGEKLGLYLHDGKLAKLCPDARKYFDAPKYFPYDYRMIQNMENMSMKEKEKQVWHPSLFIGNKGTSSPVHTDSSYTRFYMMELSGRKLWRVFSPADYSKLYPTDWMEYNNDNVYPAKFQVDVFRPDFEKFPLAKDALVYEGVLEPGDIMFIPDAWPHAVLNLEDIVSVSSNIVDQFSHSDHISFRRRSAAHGEISKEVAYLIKLHASPFFPLDHPRIRIEYNVMLKKNKDGDVERTSTISTSKEPDDNVPWDAYYDAHDFSQMAVSKALQQFVGLNPKGISRSIGPEGNSALHMAVYFNYVQAAEYLLDKGAKVDVLNSFKETPMDLCEASIDKKMNTVFEKHGTSCLGNKEKLKQKDILEFGDPRDVVNAQSPVEAFEQIFMQDPNYHNEL